MYFFYSSLRVVRTHGLTPRASVQVKLSTCMHAAIVTDFRQEILVGR